MTAEPSVLATFIGSLAALFVGIVQFYKLRSEEKASLREEKRKLASELLARLPQLFEQYEQIRVGDLSIAEMIEKDNQEVPIRGDFPMEWIFFLRGFKKIKGDFKFLNEKKYDYKARIIEAYKEYEQLLNLVNDFENYLTACEDADIPIHNPTFEKRIHRDGKEDGHSRLIKKSVDKITHALSKILK
jgi:hypothetical protein